MIPFRFRHCSILVANANLLMGQQCEELEKTLEEWKSGAEQVDDVTIMGVKIL